MQLKPDVKYAEKALKDTSKILNSIGVEFHLDGGTLLGFYRDGKFADDDHDDIDLTIDSKDWQQHTLIKNEMIQAGFEVHHMWPRDTKEHLTGQYAFMRDGIKVDIMYKEIDKEKRCVWWTIYGGKNKVTYKRVPIDLYGGIGPSMHIFAPLKVCIPTHVEKYLEYRYGDWRIPVHRNQYDCYSSDLSIVEGNSYQTL